MIVHKFKLTIPNDKSHFLRIFRCFRQISKIIGIKYGASKLLIAVIKKPLRSLIA